MKSNCEVDRPRRGTSIELQYSLKRCLDGLERKLLIDALKETRGNKAKAGRLLDVKRSTFMMKIKKFNIKPEEYNNG